MTGRLALAEMRFAKLLTLALAAALPAPLQAQSEYQPPPHVNADDIAIGFIAGRYITPVICKRTDGTTLEVEDAVQLRSAPDAAGGTNLKATFSGIDVADAEYCYSSIERRVLDRRGTIFLHFRARNRPEFGLADFRRIVKSGPLIYNAQRGQLLVRGIGPEAKSTEPLVLAFDGGDSRLVVESVQNGTDGAKLVTQFFEKNPPIPELPRRIYSFRFIPKEGEGFTFIAIEDDRRWK
jgi:hypothetical protein